jgi:hypothetical protein
MATPANTNPPTLETLAEGQQRLIDAVTSLSKAVQSLTEGQHRLTEGQHRLAEEQSRFAEGQDRLAEGQNRLNAFVVEQRKFNDKVEAFIADTTKRFDSLNGRFDGLSEKVDGLKDDIALVKGGHARNEMRRNASLIADDLGCTLISEMSQGVIVAFAKVATDNGVASNEVESFRNADMVMLVQDANNKPGYVAVEASFTVDGNDVRRATRNADYLHQYTGMPSYAVVAGVDVLPEAQQQVDQGNVSLYRIAKRDIQAT